MIQPTLLSGESKKKVKPARRFNISVVSGNRSGTAGVISCAFQNSEVLKTRTSNQGCSRERKSDELMFMEPGTKLSIENRSTGTPVRSHNREAGSALQSSSVASVFGTAYSLTDARRRHIGARPDVSVDGFDRRPTLTP